MLPVMAQVIITLPLAELRDGLPLSREKSSIRVILAQILIVTSGCSARSNWPADGRASWRSETRTLGDCDTPFAAIWPRQ